MMTTKGDVERTIEQLLQRDLDIGELVSLHARLKLLLMAHSPSLAHALGRVVGMASRFDRGALAAAYRDGVRATLATPMTVGRHVNALEHMAGYFRGRAGDDERRALAAAIEDYRCGRVALAVPLAMIRAQAARYNVVYLSQQLYLEAA